MPSIHPSENPPLGWLVPCLAVNDLRASLDFYEKLDLRRWGGETDEGWAMLRNRALEIHLFEKHIEKDLLNFRGGDPGAVRHALEERGLAVSRELGPRSFLYLDPDGRDVFFDTTEEETEAYRAGRPLAAPASEEDVHRGSGLDLGNLAVCLACADLAATRDFYERLGLVPAGGEPSAGWSVLGRKDDPPEPGRRLLGPYLTLFEGKIPADLLNFRGGDVGALADALAERGLDPEEGVKTSAGGGASLLLRDPDGRGVFLDTTPPERLEPAQREGP